MKTFWLLGRADPTGMISLEQSVGMLTENVVEDLESIVQNEDYNKMRSSEMNSSYREASNGKKNFQQLNENTSDDVFRCKYCSDWNTSSRARKNDHDSVRMSTASSIESKQYLQLETSNDKGTNVYVSNEKTQTKLCVII